MGAGGIAPSFVDVRKKKYSHDIRDASGNPINGAGGGGNACGGAAGGKDGADSVFASADSLASQYESSLSDDGTATSSADIGKGGAGVTTYGWKMFEDEERDRIMREKDSREVLEKLLQSLRDAARSDEGGAAKILRAHPQLTQALSEAMLDPGSLADSPGKGWAGGLGVASTSGSSGGGGSV